MINPLQDYKHDWLVNAIKVLDTNITLVIILTNMLITRLIVINITPSTELFCNCPLADL